MIVITDIEYIEVKSSTYTHLRYSKDAFVKPVSTNMEFCEAVECTSELIRGKRFINKQRNMDITIGISNKASTAIGLVFETIENMQEENDALYTRINTLRSEIDKFKKNNIRKALNKLLTKVGL